MNIRKLFTTFLFIGILSISCSSLSSDAATQAEIEAKRRQTQEKINRLKWLEGVETNKLYKNQQKLENATSTLKQSQNQVIDVQRELDSMQADLDKASREYNSLNSVLAEHIRKVYKTQRTAFFELLISAEDINMLVDRIYFQRIILKEDYNRMAQAKNKAEYMRRLQLRILSKKSNLERSIASMNTQQAYIQRAIDKNKNMIEKLKTDRVAYQKAERELEKQSKTIGNYISRTTANDNLNQQTVASGFMKPISGRITSPFGYRVHPIFNTRSFHSGVDIGGPNYGAIVASNSGKVIYSGWYGGYGKVVILEHGAVNGKPISTLYAHMSSIKVSNGQKVRKGDVLGYEGTTGYSTGPHCHFEVRVNGQPSNPRNYVQL